MTSRPSQPRPLELRSAHTHAHMTATSVHRSPCMPFPHEWQVRRAQAAQCQRGMHPHVPDSKFLKCTPRSSICLEVNDPAEATLWATCAPRSGKGRAGGWARTGEASGGRRICLAPKAATRPALRWRCASATSIISISVRRRASRLKGVRIGVKGWARSAANCS